MSVGRIRPLFVLPDLRGGGAERVVLNLVRALDAGRFDPELLLTKRAGEYWDEVPATLRHSAVLDGAARLIPNVPRVVATLARAAARSDVVVGALELDATYLGFLASRIAGKPFVAWVHTALEPYVAQLSPARRRVHARLVPAVYPRLPRIVVPVAGAADSLRRIADVPADRIIAIPNALDLDRVVAGGAAPIPESLAPVFDAPTVVAVGKLTRQKGLDVLIGAHARLRAAGLHHRLLLLGEGEERGELEALAARLGVADSVVLPGFSANPYPMMKAARAFVLPSRLEGFGMVVAEALALGVPVVTTDCVTGPAELVGNGRYGTVVPVGDEPALAAAIGDVLTDRTRAAALAAAGPRRAADFSPAVVAPQWERLLRSAAARPHECSPQPARPHHPAPVQ